MSDATERLRMVDTLDGYRLMGVPQAAELLDCENEVVIAMIERGLLPATKVGARWKLDPLDVVVHIMAGREGMTGAEYWAEHGEAVPERARQFVVRIKKFRGLAA